MNRTLTVCAREYFDRVNGNTYQSVRVFVDGDTVGVSPLEYGRDSLTALRRAWEILTLAGYPVPDDYRREPWRVAGWNVSVDVCPIARKRDAHARTPGRKGIEIWNTYEGNTQDEE